MGEQPLRIEAGKHYRTRDGRKVGPMAVKANGEFCAKGSGNSWDPFGRSLSFGLKYDRDLIAEWSDPAPVPPKPTPRVGDRVRLGGEFEVTGFLKEGAVFVRIPRCNYTIPPEFIAEVIPAPRPIAVGDRVRRVINGRSYFVKAIDGDWAWLLSDSPGQRDLRFSEALSDLTRIDQEQSA